MQAQHSRRSRRNDGTPPGPHFAELLGLWKTAPPLSTRKFLTLRPKRSQSVPPEPTATLKAVSSGNTSTRTVPSGQSTGTETFRGCAAWKFARSATRPSGVHPREKARTSCGSPGPAGGARARPEQSGDERGGRACGTLMARTSTRPASAGPRLFLLRLAPDRTPSRCAFGAMRGPDDA